jgi:hypothetical protein
MSKGREKCVSERRNAKDNVDEGREILRTGRDIGLLAVKCMNTSTLDTIFFPQATLV